MAKRTQKLTGKVNVAVEARRRARDSQGTPPPEKVFTDKRRKPAKHKKRQILEDLN